MLVTAGILSSLATCFASHGGSATNLNMLLAMPNAIYMETSGARKLVDGEMTAPEDPGMSSEVPDADLRRFKA